jgi:hypothetical protein
MAVTTPSHRTHTSVTAQALLLAPAEANPIEWRKARVFVPAKTGLVTRKSRLAMSCTQPVNQPRKGLMAWVSQAYEAQQFGLVLCI